MLLSSVSKRLSWTTLSGKKQSQSLCNDIACSQLSSDKLSTLGAMLFFRHLLIFVFNVLAIGACSYWHFRLYWHYGREGFQSFRLNAPQIETEVVFRSALIGWMFEIRVLCARSLEALKWFWRAILKLDPAAILVSEISKHFGRLVRGMLE